MQRPYAQLPRFASRLAGPSRAVHGLRERRPRLGGAGPALRRRHGDADAAGFFQMRLSIWNHGEYAGFPDRPELQLLWFAHQATAIRALHRHADPTFGDDPSRWGEWIADVERPPEQLRGRYQLRLDEARALIARTG